MCDEADNSVHRLPELVFIAQRQLLKFQTYFSADEEHLICIAISPSTSLPCVTFCSVTMRTSLAGYRRRVFVMGLASIILTHSPGASPSTLSITRK